jgi:hypothetical protein
MGENANREPFAGKITQKAILFGPDDEVLLTRSGDNWEPPGGLSTDMPCCSGRTHSRHLC